MLSWRIFTHYLLSRRSGSLIRSIAWICILGVAVGVMALVVVVGVMNGFNAGARDRYLKWEPHLVISTEGQKPQEVMERARSALGSFSVEGIDWVETQDLIVRSLEGSFTGVVAKGFSGEGLDSFLHRIGDDQRRSLTADEVLVGFGVASNLRVYEGEPVDLFSPEALILPPGEAPPASRMVISGRPFETGLEDIDNLLLIYNRELSLKRFRGSAAAEDVVEVRLAPGQDHEEPAQKLRSEGFKVETWPERNSAMFFALKMEKTAMTTFLGLSALITSFSILTVLVLLVTQKKKDIGMLLAMGLTPRRTRWVFTQVGMWLSGLGVGLGLIVGVVVCLVIDRYPLTILPDIYQERTIPAQVSWIMVAWIGLLSLVIGFLGSWFPASRSAMGNPAEALRG